MVTRDDLAQAYWRYTGPYRHERDINVLDGILTGVGFNGDVSQGEVELLAAWRHQHDHLQDFPFAELRSEILQIITDGRASLAQIKDLRDICRNYTETQPRFDADTVAMQRLHGILGGIASDGVVDAEEIDGLKGWFDAHRSLQGLWPFDEVDSLVTAFARSDDVAEQQQAFMLSMCREFVFGPHAQLILENMDKVANTGVCAACPSIQFEGRHFCITGHPERGKKADLQAEIAHRGGTAEKSVTDRVDYLVVGAKGNGAWAFNCYGRKVEKAMTMRKAGHRLVLVHEFDFWDAVEDE